MAWTRSRLGADLAPVLLAGILGALGAVLLHRALVEDTYITLGYARGLFERGEWGLLPGQISNTMTSPLNALLLGGLSFLTRDPLRSLWVLSVVNPMLCAWGLVRLGRSWGVGSKLAWAGVPLLFANPFLVGTLGMETLLAVTALVWLLETARRHAPIAFGVVGGLTVVLRADLVVVVAIVWLLNRPVRARLLRDTLLTLVTGAVVALPWFVWSWYHLGSAIPDTLALKTHARWGIGSFWDGLWHRFGRAYPDGVRPALVAAGAGILATLAVPLVGRKRRTPWLGPLSAALAGLAYYGTFVLLGVPPFFWYYGLPVAALTLALAWVLVSLPGRSVLAGAVAVVGVLAVLAPSGWYWGRAIYQQGPVLSEAPVVGNWATDEQYQRIGRYLATLPPRGIRSAGEFGEMLYVCRCRLIDEFDSRYRIEPYLSEQRRSSELMRLNYRHYHPRDYPRIPWSYELKFAYADPGRVVSWRVHTPIHGSGWYVLFEKGHPVPRA